MQQSDLSLAELLTLLPTSLIEEDSPVFAEPWHAQIFAMTLSLHKQGLFDWKEWAGALSSEISNARESGDVDLGLTYYDHWLSALEALLLEKQLTNIFELNDCQRAWKIAGKTTPHGQPITVDWSQRLSQNKI